ncbi:hypothetical protein FNV43_RR05710 [Rhamnella rubrinervis]|uniref:B-like cyclin n=1 Tax=Rhamnella rubrinervis TaxID=2594499 RepID=A0A8K0HM29_9ROSA|nr:hypothetical protein FNV43_RR05710 [Rhamnella rubrinervis]
MNQRIRKSKCESESEKSSRLAEHLKVALTSVEGGDQTLNGRLQVFFSSLFSSIGGVFGSNVQDQDSQMASRAALVPLKQQQHREGGKQKNSHVEGRNRRVLQDIGNLVTTRAAEGKQVPVEKNKKTITEEAIALVQIGVEKVSVAAKPVEAVKSALERPKPERIEGSSRKTKERISKKNFKVAFSSVLSARSKAACGLASKPKDPVVDIDAEDVSNELAVVEYIDEIYEFYKLSEDESQAQDYMRTQPDINAKMRSILVDWLIEVHHKFELMPETLYLTINIVDRFLSMKVVSRRELQLVGISSMLLASKYEEIWSPEVNDFVCISDNAYVREQILVMEKTILGKLGWHLTVPTPYVFLVRYVKASVPSDEEMENMVFFLAELGLMNYSAIITFSPSILAASAVYTARCTLARSPFWTETLKHHTGYSEYQLMDCAELLASLHSTAAESKLRAVYKKFSSEKRSAVALVSPAKSFHLNHLDRSAYLVLFCFTFVFLFFLVFDHFAVMICLVFCD